VATLPLEVYEKIAVLEAIVENDYDVVRAARLLRVAPNTLYRKLSRWGLTSPMWSRGKQVLRRDFLDRCEAIQEALRQLRPSR
jgi:transposase-like protein